jgi:hypothetical protein
MATPKIDAFFHKIYITGELERPTNEQLARMIGDDPKLCEERLRDAATFYVPEYRRLFAKGALFVASEKPLYASDGQHLLEYRLRDDPDAPESLENQQTSMGIVVLYRKLAAYSEHR